MKYSKVGRGSRLGSVLGSALVLTVWASTAFASLCQRWSAPENMGILEAKITEASGMAVSSAYPDHVYHINDSGSKGQFFVTDPSGKLIEKVSISGFRPLDTEDMSLGPCGNETCLFIADIGDNYHVRATATIIAIKEKQTYGGQAEIFATIKIKYPDQIHHDVEAMAIHPNGDLLVVTKDYNKTDKKTEPAKVFRLPQNEMWEDLSSAKTMHDVGTLDVASLLGDVSQMSLVTALDIAPSGNRFALLTYSSILEFDFDLSKGMSPKVLSSDYTVLPIEKLNSQESMAYLKGQDAILYTSEGKDSPVYRLRCEQR